MGKKLKLQWTPTERTRPEWPPAMRKRVGLLARMFLNAVEKKNVKSLDAAWWEIHAMIRDYQQHWHQYEVDNLRYLYRRLERSISGLPVATKPDEMKVLALAFLASRPQGYEPATPSRAGRVLYDLLDKEHGYGYPNRRSHPVLAHIESVVGQEMRAKSWPKIAREYMKRMGM